MTLLPSTPRACKLYENECFQKKTVKVVWKSIVWNQIRRFVFTFILKPHKTGDCKKAQVYFLFRFFFKRKSNNGRFWITSIFFRNMTGRNYGFVELNAVIKWFEIFPVFWSRDRWRHDNKVIMDVTFMWSSINQPKLASLRLKLP